MIIPVFVCFFSALLFFFRIMQVQLIVQGRLEEVGRNLAVLSVEELEAEASEIEYFGLAKGLLYMGLREETVIEQYVTGGAVGVSLLASEFDGDYISLKANYIMRFPIKLLGNLDVLICQNTRFRKWNGWHGTSVDIGNGEWVYVTDYGEVYHMRRSCPYLQLTIQKVFSVEVEKMRNLKGERYEACKRCVEEEKQGYVYVTDYGDKYHNALDCSGLKRTIYQKKRSEVEGMASCSKCWK